MRSDEPADLLGRLGPSATPCSKFRYKLSVIYGQLAKRCFSHFSGHLGQKNIDFFEQFGRVHAAKYNGFCPTVNGVKPLSYVGVHPTRIV